MKRADELKRAYRLEPHPEGGEKVMVVIPAGAVFAAENLRSDCYSFVSCVTAPKFDYSGFRLIGRDELRERWPDLADETGYLAYPHMDEEALTSSGSHRFL